jgi:acyl carrier protein
MIQSRITSAEALRMLTDAFAETTLLTPDMLRDDVVGWDSMGALMLMAELDERFGLQLTADASKAMRRVGDVLDYLRLHGVLDE